MVVGGGSCGASSRSGSGSSRMVVYCSRMVGLVGLSDGDDAQLDEFLLVLKKL